MIVASIVPYQTGALGLVVAQGEGIAFNILEVESIPIGQLVPIEVAKPGGKDKQRIVTDEDIASTVERVLTLCTRLKVERILIESPSEKKSQLGIRIFAVLNPACAELCEVAPVRSMWRYRFGKFATYRATARKLAARVLGNVEALAFDSLICAGAMLAHTLIPTDEEQAEVIQTSSTEAASNASQPSEALPSITEAPAVALADPSETVFAGIDPGSRNLGLCIGEGDKLPLKLRELQTLKVGVDVALDKPKQIVLPTRTIEIKTKRSLPYESMSDLANQVVDTLVAHKVKFLVIEFAIEVHVEPHASAQEAAAIGTDLLKSLWLATTIAERARAKGIIVTLARAATWRPKVAVRKSKGGDADPEVATALANHFSNWPSEPRATDTHKRDAGGLCAFGALLQQEAQAPKRAPAIARGTNSGAMHRRKVPAGIDSPLAEAMREGKVKPVARSQSPSQIRRREEKKAARRAAGCVCESKRHRLSCPLAKVSKIIPVAS